MHAIMVLQDKERGDLKMKNKGKIKKIEILEHDEGYDVYKNYYKKNSMGFDEFTTSGTVGIYKKESTAEKNAERLAKKYNVKITRTV
jgi:hypothetical protein